MSPRILLPFIAQPNVLFSSLTKLNFIQINNQQTFNILRVGDHVSINSTNNDSIRYGFIIKINDNDIIEVKLLVDTTIVKIEKT